MPNIKKKEFGVFCWVELAAKNIEKTKAFYGEIMGWEFHKTAVFNRDYFYAQKNGKTLVGIYPMEEKHVDSRWMPYIAVENMTDVIGRAKELGASIRRGPLEVPRMGTLALVRDPSGADFSFWKAERLEEASTMSNSVGSFCWVELASADPEKAKTFYTKLFNWTQIHDATIPDYSTMTMGKTMVAGIVDKVNATNPNEWLVYFSVDNLDRRLGDLKRFGGELIHAPIELQGIGKFATIKDPNGAKSGFLQIQK